MAQGMKRGNRMVPWTGGSPQEPRRGTLIPDTSPLVEPDWSIWELTVFEHSTRQFHYLQEEGDNEG